MLFGMSTSRRTLLKAGLGGVAAALTGSAWGAMVPASSKRNWKVILLTDTHVQSPEQAARAAKGFAMAQARKPDLIIFGGDNVMNVDGNKTFEDATGQFAKWRDLVSSNIKAPSHSVIGNHDIWWAKEDHPQATLRDKAMAIKNFDLPGRYYAVAMGDWKLVMLDVFHRDGCYVDAEQMAWLDEELAKSKGPVCLVSHAPILSATHFMELGAPKNGSWAVPTSWQVGNSVDLMKLFWKHPKVKLALSGHMHHIDRVDYHNVTYVCGGAVSGSWWSGAYHNFPPAFIELELSSEEMVRYTSVFYEGPAK